MADDDPYGRLPEDIFAFIQALQRRERWAWDILEGVVRGLTHKHYGALPSLGIAVNDLVHDVMKELLKPSVLTAFHGPEEPPDRRSARQEATPTLITARAGAGHLSGGQGANSTPTLLQSFIAYLRIIIRNTRRHMIDRNLRHLGATPAPSEHPEAPPSADARPTLIMPAGLEALASHPSADRPTIEIVIIWERFDLMCARMGELRLRNEPWPTRVDWLLSSCIHGRTYQQIAQESGADWPHVRDRIAEIRALLRHDRRLYDAGELPPDLFPLASDQRELARGVTPSSSPFFQTGRDHISLYLTLNPTPAGSQPARRVELDDDQDDQDDQNELREGEIR